MQDMKSGSLSIDYKEKLSNQRYRKNNVAKVAGDVAEFLRGNIHAAA